ncbi:hypothetical protein VCHC55A1_3805, partial [Vibrio cholerae HC-55A1]
MGPSRAQAPN